MRLVDERTIDGSRRFARLTYAGDWPDLFQCAVASSNHGALPLANVSLQGNKLCFCYRGYQFHVTRRDGELCLVVRDPLCCDLLLYQVACHFGKLLDGQTAFPCDPLKSHERPVESFPRVTVSHGTT